MLRLLYGAVLLVFVGCSFEMATTIDQKVTLKPRGVKSVVATATARTQKLGVIVKSAGQKVDVGIVLEEDAKQATEAMKTGKEPPKNFEYFADTDDAALKFVTHPNK